MLMISRISTTITNGGGIVGVNTDGSVNVTPASGTGLLLGVAPPVTANRALFQIGNGPIDGLAAGHYVGSANGGGYGANFTSGYTGDLLNLQLAGTVKATIENGGILRVAGGIAWMGGGSAVLTMTNAGGIIVTNASSNASIPLTLNGGPAQSGDYIQAKLSAAVLFSVRGDGLVVGTVAGLATRVLAHDPTDADWPFGAPPDGTHAINSTNNKSWWRVGGVWKGVALA